MYVSNITILYFYSLNLVTPPRGQNLPSWELLAQIYPLGSGVCVYGGGRGGALGEKIWWDN